MSVARVDPEGPDVPVERVRKTTLSSDTFGSNGSLARKKWREWFGDATYEYPRDVERPATRDECREMPRPCPFVSCSHHLFLDVSPISGALTINHPHLPVERMAETCSLDVADRGGITLEEVGAIMNLTRERIRQVEVRGLGKIKDHGDAELELPAARGEGYEVRVPHRR